MSSSGTYGYFPKVLNPNAILPQMESDGNQPQFFFGGSQIPINFGIPTGGGFRTRYISHKAEMQSLPATGRGIKTTMQKHHKIYLPKHMKTI